MNKFYQKKYKNNGRNDNFVDINNIMNFLEFFNTPRSRGFLINFIEQKYQVSLTKNCILINFRNLHLFFKIAINRIHLKAAIKSFLII